MSYIDLYTLSDDLRRAEDGGFIFIVTAIGAYLGLVALFVAFYFGYGPAISQIMGLA
jgi:hypothetical protein